MCVSHLHEYEFEYKFLIFFQSLWNSRKLMRLRNINVLKEVNRLEGDYLSNQIGSDEFMEALANFMQIKSKL